MINQAKYDERHRLNESIKHENISFFSEINERVIRDP